MDTRTASRLPLYTFPVAWLILKFFHNPLSLPIALLLIIGGLLLAVATLIIGTRAGNPELRRRSIAGIVVNGLYLLLLLYAIFVLWPRAERDLKDAAQDHNSQPIPAAQLSAPAASPSPAPQQ